MIQILPTQPIAGQKPGTSGLRKKTKVFMDGFYLHNFIQSVFNAMNSNEYTNGTLLVSGDGRYFSKTAIKIICEISFANGVKRIWIGKNGLVSTPAGSAIIRKREEGVAFGGFLLTASHNPGGLNEDFGVKYNTQNGGPAPEQFTDKVYEETKKIKEIKKIDLPDFNIDNISIQNFFDGKYIIEVIDPIEDWLNIIKNVFDFEIIKNLLKRSDFSMVYDGLYGVAGIYAKRLFIEEFGLCEDCLMGCEPEEDFHGCHPDPNLTYAKNLVEKMKVLEPEKADEKTPCFGAAGDGDCDRNMILGKGFFVSPSDSLGVIADYSIKCIPYFKNGLKGLSRSMPTAAAVDKVAEKLGVPMYETPTGWKYFGNLMDADKLSICGEESFGTGSDHIREKDGLWAVLAWLSILAYENKNENSSFVHVKDILKKFWRKYGRFIYSRCDFENVSLAAAEQLMDNLRQYINNIEGLKGDENNFKIKKVEEFSYKDSVDNTVAQKQGIIFYLDDESRIIWRLSGTGSSGATIRLYLEKYEKNEKNFDADAIFTLKEMREFAIKFAKIEEYTQMKHPTVIT